MGPQREAPHAGGSAAECFSVWMQRLQALQRLDAAGGSAAAMPRTCGVWREAVCLGCVPVDAPADVMVRAAMVLAERDALLDERDALLEERDALKAERDALQAQRGRQPGPRLETVPEDGDGEVAASG